MDIKILDSWLREHLETNATHLYIAKYLTLCGPSIERIDTVKSGSKSDYIYHIEVTTNRVDMMSVRGIAREATVILPEFGFKAELKKLEIDDGHKYTDGAVISLETNSKLVDRLMGVVLEVDKVSKSPDWLIKRLEATGLRALNPMVDITNYIMTEIGQPTHVFDYDLVKPLIGVRESKKGEKVISFDGKTYSLPGGDIVFENENGELIDLPGIIGTKNSVVNKDTKRILFFIDNNDPVRIRRTSMTLGIRTVAATLNEKNVDPEIAETALKRGILLYKKLCGAKQISKIYDVYSNKPKVRSITVSHDFIEKILGIKIDSKKVLRILNSLEITTNYSQSTKHYTCTPPTFRSKDIIIPEDIVEEIARIYGYHNLPSILMKGGIPQTNYDSPFEFENKLRSIITSAGGYELYTISLVSKNMTLGKSLKLKNPLGADTEFLRTSLKNSLINAANANSGVTKEIHFYEIANTYQSKKGGLPKETMMLSGVFSGYDYRRAKGVIESLLDQLNINYTFDKSSIEGYQPSHALKINFDKNAMGTFGVLTNSEHIYYEFEVEVLRRLSKPFPKFKPIPKFPAQVEDLTLTFPEKTEMGKVIAEIKKAHKFVSDVELKDIYNDAFTFRVWYVSPNKTLTDKEVEEVRKIILQNLQKRFGGKVK